MPDATNFHAALQELFAGAEKQGLSKISVKAGDLHRKVGGYPGPNHRMPVCCAAMRAEKRNGDVITKSPPKGNGASLTIEYQLPRQESVPALGQGIIFRRSYKMGQYGEAAIETVNLYESGEIRCLAKAWDKAIAKFTKAPTSQEKPCPIETFLGLCEAGLVKGVKKGVIRFSKNKDYGIQGVEALKNNPELAARSAAELWRAIDNNGETHNAQMDVVLALWNAGLLNIKEEE